MQSHREPEVWTFHGQEYAIAQEGDVWTIRVRCDACAANKSVNHLHYITACSSKEAATAFMQVGEYSPEFANDTDTGGDYEEIQVAR